jgi:CspA family cold shock protein
LASSVYIKARDGVPSDEAHCCTPDSHCARLAEDSRNFRPDCFRSHRLDICLPGNPILQGAVMAIGTVKFFNTSKGFGFIAPEDGGKDVFVHATAVEAAGMRSLAEGQRVSFDVQPDAKGSKAVNLKAV